MIHQLRIYEIFDDTKNAFHARFRDHAARIMRRYGFRIVAMWEAKTERRTEFVYLLEWPDEWSKTNSWAAFMEDSEWAEIKRTTSAHGGALVGEIEDRLLIPTGYSPRSQFWVASLRGAKRRSNLGPVAPQSRDCFAALAMTPRGSERCLPALG
jgi:heme-degrading monooxygenase HmoA